VVAKDILEHLTKPWLVLKEVRRVLKPEGIVLASVICYRGRRVWDDYTHVRGFTLRSLQRMFEALWQMKKLNIAVLQKAFDGRE
jgi:2-polyprenyl-3-methyl-5-hydroxy-6-metoxy-1,4-benzoquinol methylase